MKKTDRGQDPKKVPVIGLPYYIILMKLKKRVRHRGHPTKYPCFPIFRIFGREIGTAALKSQKLFVALKILILLNTLLHNDQLLQNTSIFIFLFAFSGELDKED